MKKTFWERIAQGFMIITLTVLAVSGWVAQFSTKSDLSETLMQLDSALALNEKYDSALQQADREKWSLYYLYKSIDSAYYTYISAGEVSATPYTPPTVRRGNTSSTTAATSEPVQEETALEKFVSTDGYGSYDTYHAGYRDQYESMPFKQAVRNEFQVLWAWKNDHLNMGEYAADFVGWVFGEEEEK